MSEGDVELWFHWMNIDQIKAEAEMLDLKTDEVVGRWRQIKAETLQDMRTVDMAMHMSVSLIRNILGSLGLSLGPVETAMLGTIQITVESLLRIAAAWGTTGYGLVFTVAIGAAAIYLSAWSTNNVITGMNEARGQIDHAIAATENLYSMFRMLGRG